MNYSSNAKVTACVKELAALLIPGVDSIDDSDIQKTVRLLRPAKGTNDHSVAIRTRIRQAILNESTESQFGDCQLRLANFESQCDAVTKINRNLLNPFLAIFEPLSFRPEKKLNVNKLLVQVDGHLRDRVFTGNDEAMNGNTRVIASQATQHAFPSASFFEHDDNHLKVLEADNVWVSKEVEYNLMVDLIYIFQVCKLHNLNKTLLIQTLVCNLKQGISGKHIKFDTRSESYLLDPSLKLNSTVRDTVLCICELGWLYNRVANYLRTTFAVSTDSNGVVVQAFGFALQVSVCVYLFNFNLIVCGLRFFVLVFKPLPLFFRCRVGGASRLLSSVSRAGARIAAQL
jgi:hypothetical protein